MITRAYVPYCNDTCVGGGAGAQSCGLRVIARLLFRVITSKHDKQLAKDEFPQTLDLTAVFYGIPV